MKLFYSLVMSTAVMLSSCQRSSSGGDPVLIGPSDIKIENKLMTPEALWAMGRIGDFAVSPDLKSIVYSVGYYSIPLNKSNRELYLMNADGSNPLQLTYSNYQESSPVWIDGGKKIAFLSNQSGSSQVWVMMPDGSGANQITSYDGDVEGFSFSPDGSKLLFYAQFKTVDST